MLTVTLETTQRRIGQASSLTFAVEPHGTIVVNEGTWYGPVEGDDGREYDDVLELSALEGHLLCAVLRRSQVERGMAGDRPSWMTGSESIEGTARLIEDAYHGHVFRSLDDLADLLDRHGLAYERSTQLLLA